MLIQGNAPVRHPVGLVLFGAIAAAVGLVGAVGVGAMLAYLLGELWQGEVRIWRHQALFQAVWLVFFASLFLTGLHLIVAGFTRRKRDLVPGLALYFMGLALAVSGLLLLLHGSPLPGLIGVFVGVTLVLLEWTLEIT